MSQLKTPLADKALVAIEYRIHQLEQLLEDTEGDLTESVEWDTRARLDELETLLDYLRGAK